MKEKALEAARELGIKDFKAFNGWLEKFCARHTMKFKAICGEAAFVNMEIVSEWKEKLREIIKDFSPRDIFNADETGLFFPCIAK